VVELLELLEVLAEAEAFFDLAKENFQYLLGF
jgi:hypothetical protein